MTGQNIVLATCSEWPDLLASDACLAEELERRGHRVSAHAWNVAPVARFTEADMVVLRANWDFHHDLAAFDRWLTQVDDSDAELRNPVQLIRSHEQKSYLSRYADLGFPTPATLVLDTFDDATIGRWMEDRGLDAVVVKPAWGASGHRVERVERSGLADARARWESDPDRRAVVVQQFVPAIEAGEFALVFFDDEFSHALLRRPPAGEFRVNSQYGGETTLATDVDASAIALGSDVLATMPVRATYARIDIAPYDDGWVLMEVEINEPGLGLNLAPGSAARFADALLTPTKST